MQAARSPHPTRPPHQVLLPYELQLLLTLPLVPAVCLLGLPPRHLSAPHLVLADRRAESE